MKNIQLASVFIGIVAIGLVLAGTLIPKLLKVKLENYGKSFAKISRDNYEVWSQIPGPNNFTINKQFILYNIDSISPDKDKVYLSEKSVLNYTIYRNITNTEYIDDDDSVKYDFSDLYQDLNNMTQVKEEIRINQVNIGALSAWYQITHRENYKRIYALLYNIISDMKSNIASTMAAREMYEYYFKDKTLVMRTILYSIPNAESIYSDQYYGMGNNVTLYYWVLPALARKPNTHPMYIFLQSQFGLDPSTMARLYDPNSMLMRLILLMFNLEKQRYNCKMRDCTDDELAYTQLTSQNITQTILIDYSPILPIYSYQSVNTMLVSPPEFSYFLKTEPNLTDPQRKITFDNSTFKVMFDIGNLASPKSLLNPSVGSTFLDQMGENLPIDKIKYAITMNIKNIDVVIVLYKYILHIINIFGNFGSYGGSVSDSAFAELVVRGINTTLSGLNPSIYNEYNSRALLATILNSGRNCSNILNSSGVDPLKIKTICMNIAFNMTTLEATKIWMNAFVGGRSSSEYVMFQMKFGITDTEFISFFNISINNSLGSMISQMQTKISNFYNCASKFACSINEYVYLQCGSSSMTKNILPEFAKYSFFKPSITLQNWTFSKYPYEYFYWVKQYYPNETDSQLSLSLSEASNILVKVFSQTFNSAKFAIYGRTQNYDMIKKEFGITKGQEMFYYLRNIVEKLVIRGALILRQSRDFAWGYNDPLLLDLLALNYTDNGDPAFNSFISIGLPNRTINDSMNIPSDEMVTGTEYINEVRTLTKKDGSGFIQKWEPYFDGTSLVWHYRNPYPKNILVNGTDGLQFHPLISSRDNLIYFDPFLMRPLNLSFKKLGKYGSLQIYNFSVSDDNFNKSKSIYGDEINCFISLSSSKDIPLYVTTPQYDLCNNNYLSNIYLNNNPIIGQKRKNQMSFYIDKITGYTLGINLTYEIATIVDNNISFPSLGKKMFPIGRVTLQGGYNPDSAKKMLSDFHFKNEVIFWLRLIFLFFSGICAVITILMCFLPQVGKKQEILNEAVEPLN